MVKISDLSILQRYRLSYQPTLPSLLQDLGVLSIHPLKDSSSSQDELDPGIQQLFPHTAQLPLLTFQKGKSLESRPLKVGIVLSGGQAPGGHNVITGLLDALKKLHPASQLIGFLGGPSGILKNQWIQLTEEKVAPYRNQGGFDLLGSGRTKIEIPEQFAAAEQTLQMNGLDGLVIVGGDDSNTSAAFLAEFCRQRGLPTRVVGVPKTIDGDLRNEFIEISFGFDTATKIYSEMIGNLLKDALSAKKYYFFVKLMGRSASHITLECALQTHVNLALIGEEVAANHRTLHQIVVEIADLICERAKQNKDFGVILIPEGLLEFIPECKKMIRELNHLLADLSELSQDVDFERVKERLSPEAADCFSTLPQEIQKQLLLDRDPYGNIQLSKIETERLLIALVEQELSHRRHAKVYSGQFNPQPLFYGYEGRSGLPTNFDSQYCYALGHVAALLIHCGASGYLCCLKNLTQPVDQWEIMGAPIVNMLHFEMRKNKKQAVIQKALVDVQGAAFKAFKEEREAWRLNDHLYCCPGPIQFDGPPELTNRPPLVLCKEHGMS